MTARIFTKRFEEPYALSREVHLLDDLWQRGAPVPRILSVDYGGMRLQMSDAGRSLTESLRRDSPGQGTLKATKALSTAFAVVCDVAQQGVFHLDVAARNLLVSDPGDDREMRLIDFSLALCERHPLQKPLWLRPDCALHHPALELAIAEDWRGFFGRAGLPTPTNFAAAFEIPLDAYARDWSNGFAVEALDLRWALVAHGLGVLIDEVVRLVGTAAPDLSSLAETLRALPGDDLARARLAAARDQLESHSCDPRCRDSGVATPVPRTRRQEPLPEHDGATHEPPTPERPPEVRPERHQSAATPDHWTKRWQALLIASLLSTGFATIDAIYRTASLALSDRGAVLGVAAIVIGTVALVPSLRAMWAGRPLPAWGVGGLGIVQLLYCGELLSHDAPAMRIALLALLPGSAIALRMIRPH